ncbi:MAG TPA: glycosyltransferase, partial [Alphaproteobacteria bacterium]|nr:glycosyltransferase [Alphaproteobacteria bacterium]
TETYLPYLSGVSTSTDSIAQYLASQGHKVVIANPKPILKRKIDIPKNVKLIFAPSLPDPFYNGKSMAIFPLGIIPLFKAFKEYKFDIVHIQEPGSLGIPALILSKIFKVPVVGALHFIPEQINKKLTQAIDWYIKLIYNHYDAIIAPSEYFANFLKSLKIQKPIVTISNGVDTKKFFPVKKSSSKIINFLFLGRLDGDKNVATLVKAMPYVNQNVHLQIVGAGKQKKSLHALAKNLQIENKITWTNYVDDKEMVNLYKKADCFIMMSPFEGQSIVALQAAASGLPLICANAGALPEICLNGKNGFLVDTYDFKTLAKKMNEIALNKNLREKFGKVSRKISLKHEKALVLRDLENVYNNLIRK